MISWALWLSSSQLLLLPSGQLALIIMSAQPESPSNSLSVEVLIIGAGPAGSSAAFHAVSAGWDTLIVDMADHLTTPRDKTCGDGLTPRAVGALQRMGAAHLLEDHPQINGLKLHGFGGSITAPWPDHPHFPARGSAIPRSDFDAQLLSHAVNTGARFIGGLKALSVNDSATQVVCQDRSLGQDATGSRIEISTRFLILAEGVRSAVARQLGVQWLKGLVHGIAARSYVTSEHADEPWIHSHVELRAHQGMAQPGYGWIFPLGTPPAGGHAGNGVDPSPTGQVNLGCGALATDRRPAKVNTKKLLEQYADSVREDWRLGQPQRITSALLPMGGAVSRVAGKNWAAIGDSAALVNPLNGEGIDYGIESAKFIVDLLPDAMRNPDGLRYMWPAKLREEYGDAFALARRLAMLLTMPGLLTAIGPVGMRGPLAHTVMNSAARLMGNLVTPEDRDLTARLWLGVGSLARGVDRVFAADQRPLFGR